MKLNYFTEEHHQFRQSFRDFLQKEVVPFVDEWEEKGELPRHIWREFGDMGYFGIAYPEQYGGLGLDFFYSVIFMPTSVPRIRPSPPISDVPPTTTAAMTSSSSINPYLGSPDPNFDD